MRRIGVIGIVGVIGKMQNLTLNPTISTQKNYSLLVTLSSLTSRAFPPSHLGIVYKQPLPSVCRQFRFPTPSENRKTKVFRFPLSVFRFYVYLCARNVEIH